jgi:hypothetical protein
MKIQCSCGAKYEFEVTPDMAQRPVQFICQSCGGDLSASLSDLVRQELARTTIPVGQSGQIAHSPSQNPQLAHGPLRVRLQTSEVSQPQVATEETVETEIEEQRCPKHPAELATNKCYICSKPICPKCMEVFGYVCSPLCRAKANSHGIEIPVYEGQRSVVDARIWQKTVRVVVAASVVAALLIAAWAWYVFAGSTPKVAFSVRFPEPVYSGQSLFAGKEQIVFLRGDTLMRYDMTLKKEIWSRQLVDKKEIQKKVDKFVKERQALIDRANNNAWEHVPKMPSREALTTRFERAAAAALELHTRAQSVWVASPEKLMRFDWNTGKTLQEVPIPDRYGGVIAVGDELLLMETGDGKQIATHINLTNCDWRTEEISRLGPPTLIASGKGRAEGAVDGGQDGPELAGLPIGVPGKDSDKPLDPKKVAQQAQRLSYPQRLALPAVLSNARSQERTMKELENDKGPKPAATPKRDPQEDLSIIPTKEGFLQVAVKEVEHKIVTRDAMKAPPAKSVLQGEVNVTQSAEVANEILNEMQRERGGAVIFENKSRYRVTLRSPDGKEGWTGEVIGAHPTVYPLQTVNVLAAGKLIQVFNQANKKLWESKLNFNLEGDLEALQEENAPYGMGPCVERKDTLYVIDEGVLTAFELTTGSARWRYPSIGIAGIFFDEKGMIYVNTTTAGPENIKYPRQIDISRRDTAVVLKLDPKNGKVLWTAEPGGLVNYVSGKYMYTVKMYVPEEPDEEEDPYGSMSSNVPPYVRIKRINPRNGHVMWEHFQQRAPVDIQFDKNTIRLVFKKEVQVLKFFSL